jgi:hypothetical protein
VGTAAVRPAFGLPDLLGCPDPSCLGRGLSLLHHRAYGTATVSDGLGWYLLIVAVMAAALIGLLWVMSLG